MTKEELESALGMIQKSLDQHVDISEPNGILEKLQGLTNLLGLSAECYAWSEKVYNEKLGELVMAKEYAKMGATEKKMLFASLASHEIMLHSKAERLNKGLTHGIDGLRSMISFLKEEMSKIAG